MLKSGETVFNCQIIELLVENDVYQSYLMNCPDSALSKLIVTRPDPLFDKKQQAAFLEHAEWLISQTFPGIGTPLKAGDVDGQPACLYPVPTGLSLEKNFQNDFTPRQIAQLIKDVAVCLSVPHSAGLCHGNLSPETLHLDEMTPYLADFSLSQLLRLDYHSGINPQYTSPEQVRGETPGTPADLYNLGCIFYRLLTGQAPYMGDDSFAVAKQHLMGEFPHLPDELALLQPVLASLVSPVPSDRATADELDAALGTLLSDGEIDQFVLPSRDVVSDDEKSADPVPADESPVQSDIAARVEERLKEYQGDFQVDAPVDIPPVVEGDSPDGLGLPEPKQQYGPWRFVLVLLLGVVIGSGTYFLINPQPQQLASPSVSPPIESEPEPVGAVVPDLDTGLRLWQQNDLVGAETEFKKAISAFKYDPRAYNNLAAFYAAQGNYEQARDYLEQALATNEEYATIYHNLGSVYAEMARGSYGRALQLDKSQRFIKLPVFSTEGIVNLGTTAGENVALQKADQSADVARVAEATEKIVTTSVKQPEQETSAPTETMSAEETPPVVEALHEATEIVQTEDALADDKMSGFETPDAFLQRWAQAWSSQDVDQYLSFYGDKFIPPGGKSRQKWENQRRQRLTAPKKITVSLDGFKLAAESADRMKVEALQSYQSDVMADKTRKIFDLQRAGQSWKIVRERSLGAAR